MTVYDILTTTLVLMGEDASTAGVWQGQFTGVLNLLLAELFNAENTVRAADSQDELTEIPAVSELTDAAPYCDAICRRILPYGAAGSLLAEDNPALAAQYKNKYEYEKTNAYRAVYRNTGDLTREEG